MLITCPKHVIDDGIEAIFAGQVDKLNGYTISLNELFDDGHRRSATRDNEQFTVNALILMTEVANAIVWITRVRHVIRGLVIGIIIVTASELLQSCT